MFYFTHQLKFLDSLVYILSKHTNFAGYRTDRQTDGQTDKQIDYLQIKSEA